MATPSSGANKLKRCGSDITGMTDLHEVVVAIVNQSEWNVLRACQFMDVNWKCIFPNMRMREIVFEEEIIAEIALFQGFFSLIWFYWQ